MENVIHEPVVTVTHSWVKGVMVQHKTNSYRYICVRCGNIQFIGDTKTVENCPCGGWWIQK